MRNTVVVGRKMYPKDALDYLDRLNRITGVPVEQMSD